MATNEIRKRRKQRKELYITSISLEIFSTYLLKKKLQTSHFQQAYRRKMFLLPVLSRIKDPGV
jgi:hypothetical protein